MSDIERNEMLLTVVLNELPHLKALPDKPEPPVLFWQRPFTQIREQFPDKSLVLTPCCVSRPETEADQVN